MIRIALAAALAATIPLAPATAQDRATIRTADLDLSRGGDVRRLDARIRHAARALCGEPSSYDPEGRMAAQRCRAEAARSGVDQRRAAIDAARTMLAER